MARTRHAFRASAWRWLAVLLLALGATGQAHAACASAESFTVASGSSYAITCNSASSGNWGWNLPAVSPPSHGTLSQDANWVLTYTNNGDGATSDTFQVASGDTGNPVTTFTVTITPPAASITLSPTSLSFQVGQAVNQTITASGGTGPYTFAVTLCGNQRQPADRCIAGQ